MPTKIDLGLLTADEYISRRSTTLIENPNAKLEEKFEVNNYLSRLNPEYLDEIKKLSAIDTRPISKDVKIIVTIVAYGEGARIRRTLDTYLNQDLPHDKFEIVVLDNHPESVTQDNTAQEVENFKNTNPSISVIYAHKIWREGEYATVGNARKVVFDIALTRIYERGETTEETMILSNDADNFGFDTNYLSSIIEKFNSNQSIDSLMTRAVVPVEVIKKPHLYAALNLWDFITEAVCEGEPFYLRGVSSAFRASTYCAVGGFNPKATQAEDLEIGWLIADARNWNPDSIINFKETKCIQDPRRILMATANRIPIYKMFDGFESNPEIRNADNNTLLAHISDELDWEFLQDEITGFWRWRKTGMYKWRGDRFALDFKKAMSAIGIEYEIVDNNVTLKNVDKFLSIYKDDFEREVKVIHSEVRDWGQEKDVDYFSSVSDGAIDARKRMADKVAKQIKEAGEKVNKELLESFKRFAGYEYNE